MLKKRLFKKKTIEVVKPKEVKKKQFGYKDVEKSLKVEIDKLSNVVLSFDKPHIDDVVKIFKKYHLRCCANQLAHLKAKDSKLLEQRNKQTKKELFEALLKSGLARHFSWKDGD